MRKSVADGGHYGTFVRTINGVQVQERVENNFVVPFNL